MAAWRLSAMSTGQEHAVLLTQQEVQSGGDTWQYVAPASALAAALDPNTDPEASLRAAITATNFD